MVCNRKLGLSYYSQPDVKRLKTIQSEDTVDSPTARSAVDIYDEPDALIRNPRFNYFDVIVLIFSICTFIFDTGTDCLTAYTHHCEGNMWYFGLTLAFVIVPTLIMTGFSLRWYIVDAKDANSPEVSVKQWVFRVIFLLLQLGPVLRYIDAMIYGLQVRKNKDRKKLMVKYYKRMSYEDADAGLLRLFESFLEAGPQLLLQIYIMAQPIALLRQKNCLETQYAPIYGAILSWISLAWSLVSQHRSLRLSLMDVKNISIPGCIVQFLWRLFVIGARVLALGLFASLFPIHLAVITAFRWLVMTVWIITMKTNFCDTKIEEYLYNAVLGAIFTFCYFNPKSNATRWRYFFYYLYTLTENSILISVWFNYSSPTVWYRFPAVLTHFLMFFMGLLFMILYYLLLHPSKSIKLFSVWGNSPEPKEVKVRSYDTESENADVSGEEFDLRPTAAGDNNTHRELGLINIHKLRDERILAQIHENNHSLGTAV